MLAFHLCQHEQEVKRLKWTDFDLENYVVRFERQKTLETNDEIVIDFSQNISLRSFLERTRSAKRELSPFICCHNHRGKYWKPFASFKSLWRRALDKAGLVIEDTKGKLTYPYKFKEMRYLGNTIMKDANITADKRKAVLGQKTTAANERYTHNTGKDTIDGQRVLSQYEPKII